MIDLKKLRIDPSTQVASVEKVLTKVPVKKPNKQVFVRVHPGEEYRIHVGILTLREVGETLSLPGKSGECVKVARPFKGGSSYEKGKEAGRQDKTQVFSRV